jgi:cytochrome c heme-lyase
VRHGQTDNPFSAAASRETSQVNERNQMPVVEPHQGSSNLRDARESSTIPVASPEDLPAHQQTGQGMDGATTWLYPSEQMFFDAMKRKVLIIRVLHTPRSCACQHPAYCFVQGWQPDERDMKHVVSIHNMVNERAWGHILQWEQLHAHQCNCPKLKRFQGKPKDYSPRALLLNALGYKLPFDRHDWYVDRCGHEVRYVIDFYNAESKVPGTQAAMYLDVRPALDSAGAMLDRLRMTLAQALQWW